jgi:hypothetical protein
MKQAMPGLSVLCLLLGISIGSLFWNVEKPQPLKQELRVVEHPHEHAHAEPRSGKWPGVRAKYLAEHPNCEACGRDKSHELEVHHCVPFSKDSSLELSPDNLITLCRDCHELIGHLRHFDSFNPDVRRDAAEWRKKIENRP